MLIGIIIAILLIIFFPIREFTEAIVYLIGFILLFLYNLFP